MNTHILFYIGDRFKINTHGAMCTLYTIHDKDGWNWKDIIVALEKGDNIHITQATEEELKWATTECCAINEDFEFIERLCETNLE